MLSMKLGLDFPSFSAPVIEWTRNPLKHAKISSICRQAIRNLFCMFRQSIHLRTALQQSNPESNPLEIDVLVNEGLSNMHDFEVAYSQFFEKCTQEFHRLSRAAKVSSGMFPPNFPFDVLM
jgi:hypothetical protein